MRRILSGIKLGTHTHSTYAHIYNAHMTYDDDGKEIEWMADWLDE